MSRPSSVVRSQSQLDVSETDLNKLQQQYRRAEEAKRTYTKKTQGLILRDKQQIRRLQDERDERLRSLRVSQSFFKCRVDASVSQDLTDTLARGDRIDEELEAEKAKVASLEDQISGWERKLVGQKTGGGNTRNVGKNTRWIENKLDKGRKRFNETMSRNRELREDLKLLQIERKQFLRLQSCLEKELHATRKDICNLMTKCTETFNESVEIYERQRTLVDQNAEHVSRYIKERSDLEREMSHYCKFEAFLDMKAVECSNRDSEHREVEPKQSESEEVEVKVCEDALKKILTETEESDLDTLVRNFIQMEEQSYTLLKFVNYQHNEAESIRRQISQLCSEIEIFVAEKERQQEQQQDLWEKLSIKQEATEQQLAAYQPRVEFLEKFLHQLRQGVGSLLQMSCGGSVTGDQLVSSDGVQDEDIIEDLRTVESRVMELLTLQSFLHFQESSNQWDSDSLSSIAEQLLGTSPSALSPTAADTPPPTEELEEVESVLLEETEPVSRDDLLTLVDSKRI